jgi:aspartate ammonia-lyase
MTQQTRLERDSLGVVELPIHVLYGAQTQRAIDNFPITMRPIHKELIKALGMIKLASANANLQAGLLDKRRHHFIALAAQDVIDGRLNQWFITDAIQGGAGTSVNMNANEVIANQAAFYAKRPMGVYDYIHPNDHINFGQSTNDVYPSAGRLASLFLYKQCLSELQLLQISLLKKAEEFENVLKMGRTHLQDAIPIQLGQEFKAFATAFSRDIKRIKFAFSDLRSINRGATAIGTGLNADESYKRVIVKELSQISGIPLTSAKDLVDSTRNVDAFVWASSALKTLAVNLSKMCNDLRLMASGPKTGFAEINLPERQPGSSIMPGKVNPVIAEVANQVCFNVFGNDLSILKAAEAGQLELNVFEPIIFYKLFDSIDTLTNAMHTLRINAIDGITANVDRCNELVENSIGSITAVAPHIGYANASKIARQALVEKRKLRDVLIESNLISEKELDIILSAKQLTRPGISGKKLLMRKQKEKELVEDHENHSK